MLWLISFAAVFLAFSNGANDNFKGFATVWGSQALTYRTALMLATAATVAGSVFSLVLAGELVRAFSGAGLLPNDLASAPEFMAAVALGAALTVFMASRIGFPVSTTHALLGGMIGSGVAVAGLNMDLRLLGSKFFLPLLFSPLLAGALGLAASKSLRLYSPDRDCACVIDPSVQMVTEGGAVLQPASSAKAVLFAPYKVCENIPRTTVRLSISRLMNQVHILSGATICFARSVNDTPKLAALFVAAQISGIQSTIAVAGAMAVGGLLMARRVAETMSMRLSSMDARQGLSANLITTALVLFASKLGVPVSTTHVSVGSIAGIGTGARTLDWHVLRNVLLSWAATLPLAAITAWLFALLLLEV